MTDGRCNFKTYEVVLSTLAQSVSYQRSQRIIVSLTHPQSEPQIEIGALCHLNDISGRLDELEGDGSVNSQSVLVGLPCIA